MKGLSQNGVEDPTQLRSRVDSVRIGARLTLAAAVAGIAYAAATWQEPNRGAIVALFAVSIACAHLPLAAGAERIVRSQRREQFFFAWGITSVALVAPIVALDGGVTSPLALLFALPVVFVGFSYPQGSVVAIGSVDVLSLVAVGVLTGSPQPTLAFYACCLSIIALLSAWLAFDHERQREALARMSRADSLTGCLNRRGFEERLDAELADARRSGRSAGLIVLDLDDFKQVNDTSGHAAGDELLRWTVERAGEVLRPLDALGRLGGDEFAVVVPGAGPNEAREVAERLRDVLSSGCPPRPAPRRSPPTPLTATACTATPTTISTPPSTDALPSWARPRASLPGPRPWRAPSTSAPPSPTTTAVRWRPTQPRSPSGSAGPVASSRCCAWRRCSTTSARCRSPTASSRSRARSRSTSTSGQDAPGRRRRHRRAGGGPVTGGRLDPPFARALRRHRLPRRPRGRGHPDGRRASCSCPRHSTR